MKTCFSFSHTSSLEMSLLFKTLYWTFVTSFNFPPRNVLRSVKHTCLLPSLLLSGRGWLLIRCCKWGTLRYRKEGAQTTPAALGDCSTLLPLCGKCFSTGREAWPRDPVPHFGCILEKKPIFLLVNLCSEDQTRALNILLEGKGWITVVLRIWNPLCDQVIYWGLTWPQGTS